MQSHSSVDSLEESQSAAQSQKEPAARSNSSGLLAVHRMHRDMEQVPTNPLKRTTGSILADEMTRLRMRCTSQVNELPEQLSVQSENTSDWSVAPTSTFFMPDENEHDDITEYQIEEAKRVHKLRAFLEHDDNLPYTNTLQYDVGRFDGDSHTALVQRFQAIADHCVYALNKYSWAIVDNFIGIEHGQLVLNECRAMYENNMFSDGYLIDGPTNEIQAHRVRSDQICWFDTRDPSTKDMPHLRLLIKTIDAVMSRVAQCVSTQTINGRSKALIECFPGGGTHYLRHVDNSDKDGRCITAIYYPNIDWTPDSGGMCRLAPSNSQTPINIVPQCDRLLLFWSNERVQHEVLPAYKHIFGIHVWYFDSHEKAAAIMQSSSAMSMRRGTRDLLRAKRHGNSLNLTALRECSVKKDTGSLQSIDDVIAFLSNQEEVFLLTDSTMSSTNSPSNTLSRNTSKADSGSEECLQF